MQDRRIIPETPQPFASTVVTTEAARSKKQQQQHQQPLVLSASPSVSNNYTPFSNRSSRKVSFATTTITTPLMTDSFSTTTAANLARQAPHAGFLLKFGTNIPEYKRRFFVLQPGTHLYYFLSPNDTEPRGCLDLEGAQVLPGSELCDGRFRFGLQWPNNKQVFLEARSKKVGEEWMQAFKTERLSYIREELVKAQRRNSALQSRVKELETQVREYKLVEKDRDGALEDATRWKLQFEKLEEALRQLTQYLRKQPNQGNNGDDDDDNNNAPINVMQAPGVYFSALYNTCQQIRENWKLASTEANTAVEDLLAANERVEQAEARMNKAEKHLCKLWEENCSLRKVLKQKKREKRVLVREVKNLRATSVKQDDDWSGAPHDSNAAAADDTINEGDEEKLINELEEHVLSSIRLHEQMLAAGTLKKTMPTARSDSEKTLEFRSQHEEIEGEKGLKDELRPLASLFDQSDGESDDDSDVPHSSAVSVSSMEVEVSDHEQQEQPEMVVDGDVVLESIEKDTSSRESTPERPNPLLLLDEEDDEQPQLCAASSQSESSKSVITGNGLATSKLECPLADVVGIKSNGRKDPQSLLNDELQVYHLTFYSRKIGLQFQKVPPPPTKTKGLLTDALTADLVGVSTGSNRTAAELRRIAAISNSAKGEVTKGRDDVCQVATPVDAVLVCGFVGFDDSGSNVCPKLGARLVAFDGVSVEIGRWTFDSIRKAIQARGRPLTLSFRNDFLTTEQREILTKAVADVERSNPTRRTIQYPTDLMRRPSLDPSELSHESDPFVRESATTRSPFYDDDLSLSVAGSDFRSSAMMPQSFSGAKSAASSHGNFRSFSEAGSSVSVLSAVAPLVNNLLNNSSRIRTTGPFTPDYLRREAESVEDTPQHQDFKAELL